MVKKESNEEFLKRIKKLRDDATSKVKSDEKKYNEEYEKGKGYGNMMKSTIEEYGLCQKILKEFEKDPPLLITRHVNGVSIKREYEKKYVDKVKLLKKHLFSFQHATYDISINSPLFKIYGEGKAYVLRDGIRKQLPSNSLPPILKRIGMGSQALDSNNEGFILKDNDVIITDENSFVDLTNIIRKSNSIREINIKILPNSEIKLKISEKKTEQGITGMDNSERPECIKKKSKRIIIDYNISHVYLNKGITKVNVFEEDVNVSKFIRINENYPQIEFLRPVNVIETVTKNVYEKMSKDPKMQPFLSNYKNKNIKTICDSISGIFELNEDNSLVVFGTTNPIKYNGKIATIKFNLNQKDVELVTQGKITIKNESIYSDKSDNVDPRVKAITKYVNSLTGYYSNLNSIKELEENLKKNKTPIKIKQIPTEEKEERKKELMEELEYMKKVKDEMGIEAIKMQLEELENPIGNTVGTFDETPTLQMIKVLKKDLGEKKKYITPIFPPYNSVRESDII
jgi:hypothetical protein